MSVQDVSSKNFNPSSDQRVDAIKDAVTALGDVICEHCPEGVLRDKAQLDLVSTSMFAVKSLFTK